jgi:hypothetical protein
MSDYNGWKNQATWSINVLHMDKIVEMLSQGKSEEYIKFKIKDMCQPDEMNLYGRDLFLSAWASIDWYTIFDRAKENLGDNQGE